VPSEGFGNGGQTITITGFFGASTADIAQVRLNGVAVQGFTMLSSTHVATTSAPSTGGAGPVTVNMTSGLSVAGLSFTYLAVPSLSAAVPASGPLAGGTVVTLTGSNLGNNDTVSVTFGGTPAPQHEWVSTTRVVVVTPAGGGAGAASVQLVSASVGQTLAASLFTYNPRTLLFFSYAGFVF
jgi:hypothetical protein